jgi:hemoglobin
MTMQITEEDIAILVPDFYARVREDPVLGPVFDTAIGNWPEHLEKLKAFWSSVMLNSGRYKGQPMLAHIRHQAAMKPENFARWLQIWNETSSELLSPEVAASLQSRAGRIAESLQLGVDHHRARKAA